MSFEAQHLAQQESAATAPSAVENVTAAVAKFDRVAFGLAELKAKYSAVLFDVTTTKGMKEAVSARAAIRGPRVEVEKVRKECKAPILALGRDVDARAAAISAELLAIEEPIDKQIKAEEERKEQEKQRKIAAEIMRTSELNRRMQCMRDLVPACVGLSAAAILEQIRQLVASPIDAEFQEFQEQAGQVKEQALSKLRDMHAAQVAQETEQERLRLERDELARLRAVQEESNRIERERIAAEEEQARRRREAADADALAQRQAREEERQRQIDESMAQMRAERAQRERDNAERAERQRVEDEQRAADHRRQQQELQLQQELQSSRWGEINAMGHQIMIATTGRLGVRVGGTRECIAETLEETAAWEVTEAKFGPLYPVAISARQTACDAIKREMDAWDARAAAQAELAAADQAVAALPETVAETVEATEPQVVGILSSSPDAAPLAVRAVSPTANDIAQLVSSEYGVDFQQALVWCFNAFSPD